MFKYTKAPHFKYEATPSFESGTEYLRLYLPTERGFVNFNVIRSVKAEAFADIFRLGKAFACDGNLENEFPITPERAEWDMAIKIVNREDFIGGLIHGDETTLDISVTLDGKAIDFTAFTEPTPFKEMKITVDSVGYDPDDHKTKALLHKKEYTVTENGITSRQRVEFLGDFTLENSYLAMMPPCKDYTDTLFTDKTPSPENAVSGIKISGVKSATVFGKESGISFTMAIPEYPTLFGGDQFCLSDNGGRNYNKMYFPVTTCDKVKCRDVWNSVTEYKIEVK